MAEAEKTPGQVSYEAFMRSLTTRCPDVPVVSWERLDDLARDGYASGDTQADWDAAAEAAIEAGPSAPQRLAKGNARLREENGRLRGQLQAVKQLAGQAVASGIIDGQALLDLLDAQ